MKTSPLANPTHRFPFATGSSLQWLVRILSVQALVYNCFTRLLLDRWNAIKERAYTLENLRKHESKGSKKRMLIISISDYSGPWKRLYGPKSDWRIWAMRAIDTEWNVDVLSDSLPVPSSDRSHLPTRENIWRFARAILEANKGGDQFVLVYSGHCDDKGIVLADGSHITRRELRSWFAKPLVKGARLWGFFDCCESNDLLGLEVERVTDGKSNPQHKQLGARQRGRLAGTIITIGSSAKASGEMELSEPVVAAAKGEPDRCGPLTWATYEYFAYRHRDRRPAALSDYLSYVQDLFKPRPGQEAQVTMTPCASGDPFLPPL